jgi:hypothetical protein
LINSSLPKHTYERTNSKAHKGWYEYLSLLWCSC